MNLENLKIVQFLWENILLLLQDIMRRENQQFLHCWGIVRNWMRMLLHQLEEVNLERNLDKLCKLTLKRM